MMNWHLHTSIIGIRSGLLFTVTNFFDPALPESREHICRVVGDIVRRYDIDAIHMDDYFILIRLRDKISQIMRALFVMVRILPIKEIGGVIM